MSVCVCVCSAWAKKEVFFFFIQGSKARTFVPNEAMIADSEREGKKKNYVYNTPPPEKSFSFVYCLWEVGGGDLLFCGRADVFYRCTINLRFGGN